MPYWLISSLDWATVYPLDLIPMNNPLSIRFDQAWLKIERADHHIHQLADQIRAFSQSDFYTIGAERNPDSGVYELKLRITNTFSTASALIIGDAVHNLSSSLDYIATAVVGSADNRISFPMDEDRRGLERSKSFQAISRTRSDVASAILDRIQPYKTGNYLIWALRKLDNVDKHKLLIPNVQISAIRGVHGESQGENPANKLKLINNDFLVEGGLVVNWIGHPDPIKIFKKGKASINVVFDNGSYFSGTSVLQTLVSLRDATMNVVKYIEPIFFKSPRS